MSGDQYVAKPLSYHTSSYAVILAGPKKDSYTGLTDHNYQEFGVWYTESRYPNIFLVLTATTS